MKKVYFLLSILLVGITGYAQEGTDIYLFNFKVDQNQFTLSNARNITNSPGYDNQPYFLPDGKSLLYSSDDGFGQTDIYRYNILGQNERRLTFTPNNEYSPTVTPDGKYFSCIILERNGNQFLWKYPLNGAVPQKLVDVQPVGYHCWASNDMLGLFVVGEPNTLNLVDLPTGKVEKVADSPGVTLKMIPNSSDLMSFVDLSNDAHWKVRTVNTSTKELAEVIDAPKHAQYYSWTPSGILVAGDGKRIYKFDPANDSDWVEMANLSDYGIKEFTRITISPSGDLLAVVVNE